MANRVPNSEVRAITINDATNFTALYDTPASKVVILNNTGVSIDVRRVYNGVADAAFKVDTGVITYTVEGIDNASQVQVKLSSAAGGTVTLKYEIFA